MNKKWVALIVISGFLIRIIGIKFGLPYLFSRPDEHYLVEHALRFGKGDFNPHLFFYGLYFILGWISGKFTSIEDFIKEFAINPSNFYLIDRIISSLLGTFSILVLYKIVEILWDRERTFLVLFFGHLLYTCAQQSFWNFRCSAGIFYIM